MATPLVNTLGKLLKVQFRLTGHGSGNPHTVTHAGVILGEGAGLMASGFHVI